MEAKLLLIHTLSPLHAGTGQGVGVIDLPIAREKATDIPYLPGSTLKGVFRDACEPAKLRQQIFGPDTNNAELYAGAVNFTDARLLLMPIRSLRGVFAWVTCPLLLNRLRRDLEFIPSTELHALIAPPTSDDECLVAEQNSSLIFQVNNVDQVVLEDLPIPAKPSPEVTELAEWLRQRLFSDDPAWQAALTARLCVVSDDVFSFLLETATEIIARISMDEKTKTAATGALWYEEALPTETVLASLVVAEPRQSSSNDIFTLIQTLTSKPLQFGGHATIGRGLCQTFLV